MQMIDWRQIAHARKFPVTDAEIERIAPALDALEEAFRPLCATISHDTEPAVTLSEQGVFGK